MAEKSQAATALPQPPVFSAGADVAGKQCSICQSSILGGEQVLNCPSCSLVFHADCWSENRGCSAYGCKSAPPTIKPSHQEQPVSNAWGDEKPCPSCARKIRSEALKCRFCGAVFASRDLISKDEYRSRAYEGTEYAAARNKSVMLFLLCAAACLAPLGLVLCLILIQSGSLMGVDYRRLPTTLRALLWCGVGIASLLIAIMILLAVFD